jgi:RNA polymerase sigma-70 factor, ECF subfamily
MDPRRPDHRGEQDHRAVTSSPVTPAHPPGLPEQPGGDASEQVVNCHLMAAALGRLTQEHRDVLRECYFRGSSVAQAAHALGIAPGSVKSRTYYALRALRLVIQELGDAE